MLRDKTGAELIAGQYWDYEGEEWLHTDRFHTVSVAPVDWDADGDLDLLQGCSGGKILLRRNEGTASAPAFAAEADVLEYGGREIQTCTGYAMPVVADWDGDGSWDIVAGSDDGSVEWFRNTGTRTEPSFAKPVKLVDGYDDSTTRSGQDALVAVADLNGDGRLDLLVGDHANQQIGSVSVEQMEKRRELSQRMSEFGDLSELMAKRKSGEELTPEEAVRMRDWDELMAAYREVSPKFERRANVWLYLRAPLAPASGF